MAFDPVRRPIDGVDAEAGLAAVGGNIALYGRLLGKFLRTHEGDPARWSDQLQQGRPAEAQVIVHRLRGGAATLGLVTVADAARDLELALAGGAATRSGIDPASEVLAGELQLLGLALIQALGGPPVTQPGGPAAG